MFRNDVFSLVKDIPVGNVSTYGYIASVLGKPRAARQVGYALRSLTTSEQEIPWWRVVNKKGYLSIDHGEGGFEKDLQKSLLEGEGVEFEGYYIKNLNIYLYNFI